jgi:hypothetical protein
MHAGTMPVHLLLIGPPSVGKSYTINTVLKLLPRSAYHEVDAGSPRVLIYDTADLQHRVLLFGEADSLPAGEDNPAASAIRNLLQDHHLHYKVVERNKETKAYGVRDIAKAGPTVLFTTAVRSLGQQLETRLFKLTVPDDPKRMRAALLKQASIEKDGVGTTDEAALVKLQEYLQTLVPWDVVVPFAPELAEVISASIVAPRITRDFSRLLSLIKAVAVLRHRSRSRDAKGRLVATVEDYAKVYELAKDMYAASLSGAEQGVCDVVKAVAKIGLKVTKTEVASYLDISKPAAGRRIAIALREGWLVNAEHRKGYPAKLEIGEPLPDTPGLPHPDKFREGNGVTGGVTAPVTRESPEPGGLFGTCNAVTPLTGGDKA